MAYGARLESVLGASPRGFESPILRQLGCAAGCARSSIRGSNPPFSANWDAPPGARAASIRVREFSGMIEA